MTREDWYAGKFMWLKRFFLASAIGLAGLIIGFVQPHEIVRGFLTGVFILPLIPLIFMLCFIPILHWKDRYIGSKSNLWGFFLVFETSGWSKIFYWFMHILPDKNKTGAYAELE